MAKITIEAHGLDEAFEALIKEMHNVTIIDKSKAPWEITFQGTVEDLVDMVSIHWNFSSEQLKDYVSSNMKED